MTSMNTHSVPYDASQHRNIIVPSSIFYDDTKEYRIIVDSALGQAEVRVAFGQVIDINETSDSDTSPPGTQDSDNTVAKQMFPEKRHGSISINSGREGKKWLAFNGRSNR